MTLPLEGIKILDLSRLGSGCLCTMILADLGAEVTLVEEPPGTGGRCFHTPLSPISAHERRKAAFYALTRNKKSLALNLKLENRKTRRYDDGF